jgi:hypothetical protein
VCSFDNTYLSIGENLFFVYLTCKTYLQEAMKLFFLILICISICSRGFSQDPPNTISSFNQIKAQKLNLNSDMSSVQGTPYLTVEFSKATIKFLKGDSLFLPVRYNIFQDEMEYQNNKEIYWLDKLSTKSVLLGNDKYILVTYQNGSSVTTSYFILLVSGKYTLLKKVSVFYMEAENAIGYNEPKPNRFERKDDEYYVKPENQSPILLRNKKDLLSVFSSFSEQLNGYLSQNKIKFSKEKDLIQLVNFMNSDF